MGVPLILTVKSTHFYLLDCPGGKLLVDAGWELAQFQAQLKAVKLPITHIRYVFFTHAHPDHAGLVQDIKNLSGARLIIHQKQIPYLEQLRAFYARKGTAYTPVRVEKTDLVSPSPAALQSLGIRAELVETPGHSDDSVSLVTESGEAYIGDLPAPEFCAPENAEVVRASWQALLNRGVHTFYHSHTPPIPSLKVLRPV